MTDSGARVEPLTETEAFALGVEAYIFGYPLLVMDSLRRVMTNVAKPQGTLAPAGQFAHHRLFPGATDRSIAGASLDTLYSLAWLDLADDAYLLRLPAVADRFYMMPILDGWTEVIGNPGTRTTGAEPGEYVISRTGWEGEVPCGAEHIQSGTDMVLLVGRTYSTGTPEDYELVHALQDQYTLSPLSHGADADAPDDDGVVDPGVDMTTPPRDQVDNLPAVAFFQRLAVLLRSNPPTPEDAGAVNALTRLGVLEQFDENSLPPVISSAFSRVPEAAHQQILGQYARQRQANGWMISTGSGRYGRDYLQRALVAYIGVGGNLPEDAFYPIARFDGDGKVLNGANRYVMRFTAADIPPVAQEGFWSLSLYDSGYFLVPNGIQRHSIGSHDSFRTNTDGSIDLYIGKDSPGGELEANWLPAPDGDFVLMMRLYSPKDEALGGTWAPPPVRLQS